MILVSDEFARLDMHQRTSVLLTLTLQVGGWRELE